MTQVNDSNRVTIFSDSTRLTLRTDVVMTRITADHISSLGLPYVRNFPDMCGILALKFVSGNNFKNALISAILTVS